MSRDPFDALSDPGIPGYRLAAFYEKPPTRTTVLAADSLTREDESRLTEDLGQEPDAIVMLGTLPAGFALVAALIGFPASLILPSSAAATLGIIAGIAAAVLLVVSFHGLARDRERAMAARSSLFVDSQGHMVRICSTRDPARAGTRTEERIGSLAYTAARRYREASHAAAEDPVLAVHLPDVPNIARDALDTYRDRAWPPTEEVTERKEIEGILDGFSPVEDDSALRRLRSRQSELADRVRERRRVEQAAHDKLIQADGQVRHVLARVRAREHLAHEGENTAGISS